MSCGHAHQIEDETEQEDHKPQSTKQKFVLLVIIVEGVKGVITADIDSADKGMILAAFVQMSSGLTSKTTLYPPKAYVLNY
jgi:hypothetical protein